MSRVIFLFAGIAVFMTCGIARENRTENRERAALHTELTQALNCLTRREVRLGLDPSFADEKAYRVSCFYGVRDPDAGRDNELDLIVYGRDRRSALLYELLVAGNAACPHFSLINAASLKLNHGRWLVTETLGGAYSYKRIQQLADSLSKRSVMRIPRAEAAASCAECSLQ